MKATGVTRPVDELGRIVIPKELRRSLDIKVKDPIEIYVEDELIILKKYAPHGTCAVTGEISTDNKEFAGGKITLSPEGAKDLLKSLKDQLNNF